MDSTATKLIALVVGIDEWAKDNVPDLAGCLADAELIAQLFRDQFGAQPDDIRLLLAEDASRAGIEAAFRSQLINRAKAMTAAELKQTAFVFHYSGHGSRARQPGSDSATGFDETIVPQDSRTNDVYDIKDWELGSWIDELTQSTINVTVILDCCHSGSGTRDVNTLSPRQCAVDMRSQPAKPATRSVEQTDLSDRYTLIAACRADEVANEIAASETGASVAHGVMSYFLTEELSQVSNRSLTYRELHERLRHRVNRKYPRQVPQCEGAVDRLLFGGMQPSSRGLRSVVDLADGYHWIDLGQSHGLTNGSTLSVFPPEIRALSDAATPVATLRVEDVGAIRSACVVLPGEDSQTPEVPLHSRVTVNSIARAKTPYKIGFQNADEIADDVLESAALKPLVERNDESPEIIVTKTGSELRVEDVSGRIVPSTYQLDGVSKMIRELADRVRFQNALEIRNTAPDSELSNAIRLEIKQLAFDETTQDPIAEPHKKSPGGEIVVEVGDRLVLEMTNRSEQPLYVYLFNFAHDGSVARIYPKARGMQEKLAPGRTVAIGQSRKKSEQLWVQSQEQAETLERLKVFATIDETNFDAIEQGAVGGTRLASASTSALSSMLSLAASGHRGLGAPPSSTEDEWTTTELDFRVIRPTADATYMLGADRETEVREFGMQVRVPDGFRGDLRVMTTRQRTRMVAGEAMASPTNEPVFAGLFEPRVLGGLTRSSADATVVEIECDDASRQLVTEDTVITLSLPKTRSEDSGTLVVAEQGGMFFPVGRSTDSGSDIAIEWLPPEDAGSTTEDQTTEDQEIRTRSVVRTIRLYLYRLANIPAADLGLRRVRYFPSDGNPVELEGGETITNTANGSILSRAFQSSDLEPGQRVLLLVHGFQSDTQWMVEGPSRWLADAGVEYDHVLTYDYESFNTHVADNAEALAAALGDAGFGPEDGVHLEIIAHSMGGVVSRAMIELHGGSAFVDRCLFAGSPHSGTILAEGIRFIPWLGTLLVNAAGPSPPTLLASWVLKKVTGDAVGPSDLRPTSNIIKRLAKSKSEAVVPYFLLAGDNSAKTASESQWQAIAQRLKTSADLVLDQFFGGSHDMVVSTTSASTIRDGRYPNELLSTAVATCDHFGYFDQEEAREQITRWLK